MYIETHHVMPVSQFIEGSLNYSNLITVCANHHRQLHYGDTEIIRNTQDRFVFNIDGQIVIIKKRLLNNND